MPVVNIRTHQETDHDLYIGRGDDSPLGNPYTHISGKTKASFVVGSREESIEMYRKWLWQKIQEGDQEILAELRKITPETNLVCFCAPRPCHGKIVERAAKWLRDAERKGE